MALGNFVNTLNSLNQFDFAAEFKAIVERNGERINELQQEQLAAGIDRSGKPRIDEYRPLTVHLKQLLIPGGLGRETDRVTFYMFGNLYRSLQTKFFGNEFQVESPLFTYGKMLERIGPENYGLSPDQRLEFAETITLPEINKAFNTKVKF